MSTHIMVDIETMATGPTAAIVSIGACAFDMLNLDEEIKRRFEIHISLESNEAEGRKLSAGTVSWWLKQSKEAQAALFIDPITNLRSALVQFRMWVQQQEPKATHVWAKDPDFDCVILKHAFDQFREIWPFQYWQHRSVRTITEAAYPDGDEPDLRVGVHHSAADDAITQALMVRHCWHKIQFGQKAA